MITFKQFLIEQNTFKQLKKNKQPLTDEERAKVIKAKAVWHNASTGKETAAVWKSVCPKSGKTTYVTNTHRAMATAPTLQGAIDKYHGEIKGTA